MSLLLFASLDSAMVAIKLAQVDVRTPAYVPRSFEFQMPPPANWASPIPTPRPSTEVAAEDMDDQGLSSYASRPSPPPSRSFPVGSGYLARTEASPQVISPVASNNILGAFTAQRLSARSRAERMSHLDAGDLDCH